MTGTTGQLVSAPAAQRDFVEFICQDACIPGLKSTDKTGAVRELVASLSSAGVVAEKHIDEVVESILRREELGTTGIGRGIGIPHTKHPGVTRSVGVFGTTRSGIDFDSLDGEPVHVVFLLVSPPDEPGSHLQALEQVSTLLRTEITVKLLTQSSDVSEMIEVVRDGLS